MPFLPKTTRVYLEGPTTHWRRRGWARGVTLVLVALAVLAGAWLAARTSAEAKGRLGAPAVKTRTLALSQRLSAAPAVPGSNASAPATSTLDAGMQFTMLGVRCQPPVAEGDVLVRLRTSTDGRGWSRWYEAVLEKANDAEGAPQAYTEALWTGPGRYVQVRVQAAPGAEPVTLRDVRLVALDTDGDESTVDRISSVLRRSAAAIAGIDLVETATAATSEPTIVTRSQWGANESLRKGTPVIAPVKMAFVHHTAGGNTYSADDAPGLVRGIYVYHTTGLGWSDIGYNFLVDRFGTIYEGRAGGMRAGVVGAQVYGFNTGSTGVSVMGTYTSTAPSSATVASLERLLAWKLGIHGLDPQGTAQMTCGASEKYAAGKKVVFPVIAGHRDANYTSCPGDGLYTRLGQVRTRVAALTVTAVPQPWQVSLELSPAQVAAGDQVSFSGQVSQAGGQAASGQVSLQLRAQGTSSWKDWRSAGLAADGSYQATVTMTTPDRNWEIRALMPAAGANQAAASSTAALTVTAVPQPWQVSLELSPAQVAAGDQVSFSGQVSQAGGQAASGQVSLQLRAQGTSSWKDWRSAGLAADGSYQATVTMTTPDRNWEIRALMPAAGANQAAASSTAALTVTAVPQPWQVSLELSPAQVAAGDQVSFSGQVSQAGGQAASGQVSLQLRAQGTSSWKDWRSAGLAADGSYQATVTMTTPDRNWEIRALMPAAGANQAAASSTAALTVTAVPQPWQVSLELSPAQVAAGDQVSFSGQVSQAGGQAASGQVSLQLRAQGTSSWKDWRSAGLAADGSYQATVTMTTPDRNWEIRALMPAAGANQAAASSTAALTVTAVPQPWQVSLELSPAQVAAGDQVSFSGQVSQAGGQAASGQVSLQLRAQGTSSWKDWRSAGLAADGSYQATVTMTTPDRNWEIRALMPAAGANQAAASSTAALTVTAVPQPWQVSLELSPAQVAAGDQVSFSGQVSQAGGQAASGQVSLQLRAQGTSSWKDWRSAGLAADGSYQATVTMTTPDRNWEIRALMPAAGANQAAASQIGGLQVIAGDSAAGDSASYESEAVAFRIDGHGSGHGIGMSQWGARGHALQGSSYAAILQHYYTGISLDQIGNPTVRVLLAGKKSAVKLTCASSFTARAGTDTATLPAGATATTTYTGGAYRVTTGSWSHDYAGPVTFTPSQGRLAVITATDAGVTGSHRGKIRVQAENGSLLMINDLAMEDYLKAVVPVEMPASWPAEALKAQACAARAYAEAARQRSSGRYDLYSDTRSQVYGGVQREDSRTNAAVAATAGIVPSAGGQPIQAFYFSSSGGQTENVELAWQTGPLSYLKSVADPYEADAPLHTWGPLLFGGAALDDKLGTAVRGSLRAICVVERGASPRVVKAAIIGSEGVTYMHGSALRSALSLSSAWASFRSMSVTPAASEQAVVLRGAPVLLEGRIYPALPDGRAVELRSKLGGTWSSQSVPTERHEQSLPGGYVASYSSYRITIYPSASGQYRFAYDGVTSPTTSITVASQTT